MWEILSKICEWCVGLGMVVIMFGMPAFFFKQLVINPLLVMRREIKAGKSFFPALKAAIKTLNSNGNIPSSNIHGNHMSNYSDYCQHNHLSSPSYSHLPWNIFNR